MTPSDRNAETLVPCPACTGGMVRPSERERLRKLLKAASVPPGPIDLASGDLDEVDE